MCCHLVLWSIVSRQASVGASSPWMPSSFSSFLWERLQRALLAVLQPGHLCWPIRCAVGVAAPVVDCGWLAEGAVADSEYLDRFRWRSGHVTYQLSGI